ncbi:hypothetical protein GALMADRAFT_256949 [Galerina marginata CBS 339.88]|uniref:Pyruvate carboxylase n=1 Tax=Galerina marginata (strain CBS 339.88) TaxID=685588 RepID=A0A067SBN7_GALM3|nr:hypothetical protein GALMADRAFT_256949 [Galerina marginata CBS 339.88]
MPPKVLIANRGEIAIRILRSASELGWSTVAVYTEGDSSHATFADEAVRLASTADFLNVDVIVDVARSTQCTHLHPGYGFLSENPALPLALSQSGGSITFIGPSPSTLRIASDKMLSRELASSLGVQIAPGMRVTSAANVHSFAAGQVGGEKVGYPVMIKALDGGGGRGIRVVEDESGVEEAFKRCLGESPSKQLFVEKALTGTGWKHIEVQIIGDGTAVNHLWERECSVQRRFQKIVEIAPSRLPRSAIQPLLDASLKMANHLKYKGLGTFEFLVNTHSLEWVFLEINPRVQVEHTITEEICNIDLVRAQLILFSSSHNTLSALSLHLPPAPPTSYAIQLRLTAENPQRGFQLSPGTLRSSDVVWPGGRGVRIDTWLAVGPNDHPQVKGGDGIDVQWVVGTDFDSLLAKIIVHGSTFEEATEKGLRAVRELWVGSGAVKTNVAVLAGTLTHQAWIDGAVDTLWLERNATEVLRLGEGVLGRGRRETKLLKRNAKGQQEAGNLAGQRGSVILQPGSLFHLTLSPSSASESDTTTASSSSSSSSTTPTKHSITLASIAQNAFPEVLSGTFLSSFSAGGTSSTTPISFTLTQSTSANVSTGQFELADPNDPTHVGAPMTGKIVEVHPALAAVLSSSSASDPSPSRAERNLNARRIKVRKGDALVVLSVMKMENVIAAPFDGYVERVGSGVRVGVVLGEGMLICVLSTSGSMGDGASGKLEGRASRL